MQTKTRVIPIFLPMLACPHRCIYCNQFVISGQQKLPKQEDVLHTIESHLKTIPEIFEKRVAFFGGSFTCLPIEIQNKYLDIVQPYITEGFISGIQISTCPDYINSDILKNLKNKNVNLIELGAQSLDDEVLAACERGHTVEDVKRASNLIHNFEIALGLQMMIGLPLDTKEKALKTAKLIHKFGAKYTRIYPTLVVENTKLAEMYAGNCYKPLSLSEAVDWCKNLLCYFNSVNINVLRVGLHPTADLRSGENILAGPFHISFKELVLTAIWNDKIQEMVQQSGNENIIVKVPESEINYAVGYKSANKKAFPNVVFELVK